MRINVPQSAVQSRSASSSEVINGRPVGHLMDISPSKHFQFGTDNCSVARLTSTSGEFLILRKSFNASSPLSRSSTTIRLIE
jgi:hypothetical protein